MGNGIPLRDVLGTVNRHFVHMLSTRANYWLEFVVDALLMFCLAFLGWTRLGDTNVMAPVAFASGLLAYSFIEYFFHRWLFHTNLPWFAQGHQKHHEDELGYDSLPFFLPALIIIVLAALAALVIPTGYALWFACGIDLGYIIYGLCHFTIHHVRFEHPLLKRWAAIHHIHHHHPDKNFGVTTPLWDFVLGTRYVQRPAL